MVSSVSSNAIDLALVSRAQASVPLAAQAQAFLAGPSNSQQREAEAPSPLEVVQSINSPVDGRTLVAAQEASEQNDDQQQSGTFNGQSSSSASTQEQSDSEKSSNGDTNPEEPENSDNPEPKEGQSTPANPQGLTEEEIKQVKQLKRIDREVRAHERSHQNAAPELTGPRQLPDGARP